MASNIFVTTPQITAVFAGLFVFFLVVLLAVLKDEIENKNSRIPRPENEWLFTRWDEKLYDAITKKEPERLLQSLGVDVEGYIKNCVVAKIKKPNLKKLAADKIIGIFIILLGLLLIIIAGAKGIIVSVLTLIIGYMLYQGNVDKVKKEAANKRKQLQKELPRFLDLLQTALYIDIPVSDAILVTAKQLKNTLVSEELITSIAESQMGSLSWQSALQELALMYDVDTLSDFVQYLINGYEKGLNIYDVVARQAVETRKVTLINAEENANKLNTSILIPIGVFKLFPLIAIIAYPVINEMLNSGTLFG